MAKKFTIKTFFSAINGVSGPIKKMQESVDGLRKNVFKNSNSMKKSLGGIGSVMGGILGAQALQSGLRMLTSQTKSFLAAAGNIEQVGTGFGTILKNVEAGKQLVQELNEVSAETPFKFDDLAKAANRLIAGRVATKDTVIGMVKMLGDTAGGSAEKLTSIVSAFSFIQSTGRASMEHLKSLVMSGVPILAELGDELGVTQAQLEKMVSAGQISGPIVEKVFRNMTGSGGLFHRSMEKMSKTYAGSLSTLQDNITATKVVFGSFLLEPVTKGMNAIIERMKMVRAYMNQAHIKQRIIDSVARMEEKVKGTWLYLENWVKTNRVLLAQSFTKVIGAFKLIFGILGGIIKLMYQWRWVIGPVVAVFMGIKAVLGVLVAFQNILKTVKVATFLWAGAVKVLGLTIMGTPIGWIIAALGAIALGAVVVYKNFDKIKNAAKGMIEWVKNGLGSVAKFLGLPSEVVAGPMDPLTRPEEQLPIDPNSIKTPESERIRNQIRGGGRTESGTKNSSTIDVNFNNMPQNVDIRVKPAIIPGLTVRAKR